MKLTEQEIRDLLQALGDSVYWNPNSAYRKRLLALGDRLKVEKLRLIRSTCSEDQQNRRTKELVS